MSLDIRNDMKNIVLQTDGLKIEIMENVEGQE